MNWQVIVGIANVIVALGVVVAITQININRKQLHFVIIARCIEEFRKLGNLKNDSVSENTIRKYLDLVNEELFYFQHDYLPKELALEWLDGMIDYISITDQEGNLLNTENCIPGLAHNDAYLESFPRLKETFIVRQKFSSEIIYSNDPLKRDLRILNRKQVAEELYNNVIRFAF
jgi:hypothetical protein